MQLCEFCTQYNTCLLEKRMEEKTFDPCSTPPFELIEGVPQDRYEQVKALLLRVRSQAEAMSKDDRPVYKIDIPMAFTEKDVLGGIIDLSRTLHLDFLETDLSDREQAKKFLDREDVELFIVGNVKHEGGAVVAEDLKAVQADLKEMMGRWEKSPADFGIEEIPLNLGDRKDIVAIVYRDAFIKHLGMSGDGETDIFRLNVWVHKTLWFSFERTDKGVIKPFAALALGRLWYGILYFLFARDVIEQQEYKRCPVCEAIFRPPKTGPAGATCGKQKCKTALSRDPQRFGVTVL